ncbi:MAG: proteasome assembly chaperone family protein [Methanimicrococcus sp.]|nr:proteasome assembly chaperone family protein [Methanimicrococcus sp.]
MNDEIIYHIDPAAEDLNNPVMIVGLPGVGHVGKFVADHLVEVLGAQKIIEIYSDHFPPQVMVGEDSTVTLVGNRVYLAKTEKTDLLILAGDSQSTDPAGHYSLCETYIGFASQFKVKRIFTLGGYPTGIVNTENYVIGAVNNKEMVEPLKEKGIKFSPSEPPGGIVGASGLILAFAQLRGIDAACLMGSTTGYIADPLSSKELLGKLCGILEIEVDFAALDEKIKDMEQMVEKIKDSVTGEEFENYGVRPSADEDLNYFG